jgi:hypothetical protein
MKKLLVLSALTALASGCGVHSPSLVGSAPAPVQVQEQAGLQNVTLSPKVDVLLVIDNSESMEIKQEFLLKYIQYFTNALSSNKTLDIHLGVIPIYDGTRYGTAGSRNFLNQPFAVTSDQTFNIDTQTGYYGRGAMRGLVDPASGKRADSPRFFTHIGSDNIDQINATLNIGVDHFVAANASKGIVGSGPEFEEMFSPIAAALFHPTGADNVNPGFYRDDAALVVIFLTDGEDPDNKEVCSEIGSDNQVHEKPYYAACDSNGLATYLTNLKHKDQSRLFTYGVLIPSSEGDAGCSNNSAIKRDNSMKRPASIERLLVNTGGNLKDNELDLCHDNASAGEALTHFGDDVQKAASIQRIPLNATPDVSQPITVTYNGEDISNNPDVQIDWKHNQLVIQPTIKLAHPTVNGSLTIKFTPGNAKFSHAHVLAQ